MRSQVRDLDKTVDGTDSELEAPQSPTPIAAGCRCTKHRYLTMARVDFLGIIDYRVDKRRSAQRSLDSRTAAADRESTIYIVQSKHIDYA